jgi:hypothetical protein
MTQTTWTSQQIFNLPVRQYAARIAPGNRMQAGCTTATSMSAAPASHQSAGHDLPELRCNREQNPAVNLLQQNLACAVSISGGVLDLCEAGARK